jgi:GNAT superfamily N-acetyltransferase
LDSRDNSVRGQTPVARLAGPEDATAVAGIAARAWRAAYEGILAADVLERLDPDQQAVEWRAYLADLPALDRLWLIGAGDEVWGFARTGPSHDADLPAGAGEVHGLYLEPDRIGTGLGRQLFGHAVADVETRHNPVVVWHFTANTDAGRFYERAGFAADGASRQSEFGVPEMRRRRT